MTCDSCQLLHTTVQNCVGNACPMCTAAAQGNATICVSFHVPLLLSQSSLSQSQAILLICMPCKLSLRKTLSCSHGMWSLTITDNDPITGWRWSSRGEVSQVESANQNHLPLCLSAQWKWDESQDFFEAGHDSIKWDLSHGYIRTLKSWLFTRFMTLHKGFRIQSHDSCQQETLIYWHTYTHIHVRVVIPALALDSWIIWLPEGSSARITIKI